MDIKISTNKFNIPKINFRSGEDKKNITTPNNSTKVKPFMLSPIIILL